MNSTGYHSSGTNGGSMNQTKVQLKPIKEERTQRPPRANSRPSGQVVGHVSNKKQPVANPLSSSFEMNQT